MGDGVTFTGGGEKDVQDRSYNTQPSCSGGGAGPMDSPVDAFVEKGIGSNSGGDMPPRGGDLESPVKDFRK